MASTEPRPQIAVYETVDPSFMVASADFIGRTLFGVRPGESASHEFAVNTITGYFRYRNKLATLSAKGTPQTAAEAEQACTALLTELTARLNRANQARNTTRVKGKAEVPFPVLFRRSDLKVRSLTALYGSSPTEIVGWRIIYGMEVPSITSAEYGQLPLRAPLEGAAVVAVISGRVKEGLIDALVSLDYNALPIIGSKSKAILDGGRNDSIIYINTTSTIHAPYYQTNAGKVPASVDSVSIQSQPFSTGVGVPFRPAELSDDCTPLITVYNIVRPSILAPGSASIDIEFEYRVVTEGEGAIAVKLVPEEFARAFSKGDLPHADSRPLDLVKQLYLKELPEQGKPCVVFANPVELNMAYTWQQSGFTNFYIVSVKYKASLLGPIGYRLYDGLIWAIKCRYSRGLVFTAPFVRQIAITTAAASSGDIAKRQEENQKLSAMFLGLALEGFLISLGDSIDISNKDVVLTGRAVSSMVLKEARITSLMTAKGSNIFLKNNYSPSGRPILYVDISKGAFAEAAATLDKLRLECAKAYNDFKATGALAIGLHNYQMNGNFVITNLDYYGRGAKKILDSTPALEIVHEVGHNLISNANHPSYNADGSLRAGNPKYGYNEVGLQSNFGSNIYPTIDNTADILSDYVAVQSLVVK